VRTHFEPRKILARPSGALSDATVVHGYEIHHGQVTRVGGEPFFDSEGCRSGSVAGTVWHGLLENDEFRRQYLTEVSRRCGRRFAVVADTSFAKIREARLDRLGDLVADHIDQDLVRGLLENGGRPGPTISLVLGR
jgi:adenosylcobyric acid synthase